MPMLHEDTFQEPLATVVVSQVELAEAFLDQRNEGQPTVQLDESEEEEDESGGVRAKESPGIKDKAEQKKSGQRQQSESPGKSTGYTRATYIMPSYRYPIAVEGACYPSKLQHYSVIINVKRAVQYGAIFSPATKGREMLLCNLRHSSKCYCPDSNEPRPTCQP